MGASGPFVAFLRILQPPQQLIRPEPFPGQHFPHHPVDPRLHEGRLWGRVIRGISPPLIGVGKNGIVATDRPRRPWIPACAGMTEWAR